MLPYGYAIRPPSEADLDAIAEVLLADDLETAGRSDYDAEFVRAQWRSPGFEPGLDGWLAIDAVNAAVGFALVLPENLDVVKSWGVVHPRHRGRGVGSALLDRVEARAVERLGDVPGGALHHAADQADEAAARMLVARGFEHVRSFRHMEMSFDGPIGSPGPAPAGVAIRDMDPERDLRSVHAIFVEAFRDEWMYRPSSYEEWAAVEVEVSGFDAGLWFVALEGDRPVGAISGSAEGEQGWIGELGVLPARRGRGIATSLLRHAFARFAERGFPRVRLNVDAENPTGAVRLYERVGMRVARGWEVYAKPVAAPSSGSASAG
ncbi:MAG TPA: GNAT family N-acetyltransferase [Actinomycetota bacterium]|jgi:ribosomal protein S18 acetylase RimI-like enzyme